MKFNPFFYPNKNIIINAFNLQNMIIKDEMINILQNGNLRFVFCCIHLNVIYYALQ